MEELNAEFKRIALELDLTIITPKARPMTEQERLDYEEYMADSYRCIDYIGSIR